MVPLTCFCRIFFWLQLDGFPSTGVSAFADRRLSKIVFVFHLIVFLLSLVVVDVSLLIIVGLDLTLPTLHLVYALFSPLFSGGLSHI